MGRLSEALAAGRVAVARAETRRAAGAGAMVLLAPGLAAARLDAAIAALDRACPPGAVAVVVADHLPGALVSRGPGAAGPRRLAFEHLMPMADLLSAASPVSALAHRVRRVALILDRHGASECLWAGAEAEDVVRALSASIAADDPLPPLSVPASSRGDTGRPIRRVLFQPVAFRT